MRWLLPANAKETGEEPGEVIGNERRQRACVRSRAGKVKKNGIGRDK